jgi:2-oxo-4-hydroxy-4-carboxy-5-ureidoimidazoline decarboxylase
MNVDQINSWTEYEARETFLRCCGSSRWSEQMARHRPFESDAALLSAADHTWWALEESDWLEAFAAHPKIGEGAALVAKFAATAAWSAEEQAGVSAGPDDERRELALMNARYQERFGYIFIVCATGKSVGEMLALLRDRLRNSLDEEIRIAAVEQSKITRIRLEKITP